MWKMMKVYQTHPWVFIELSSSLTVIHFALPLFAQTVSWHGLTVWNITYYSQAVYFMHCKAKSVLTTNHDSANDIPTNTTTKEQFCFILQCVCSLCHL